MFYTVYQTTHITSGRIYVGMHTTKLPNDSYLGSGTLINRAIKKYGRDAFKKEVLFVFSTPEEMISKEKEIVTVDFVSRTDTFNLNPGGEGSWYWANQSVTPAQKRSAADATNRERKKRGSQDPHYWDGLRALGILAQESRKEKGCKPPIFNRPHSEATRSKMRATHQARGNHVGEKNSQYGSCWISKEGSKPRKVPSSEVPAWEAEGWRRGRTSLSFQPLS